MAGATTEAVAIYTGEPGKRPDWRALRLSGCERSLFGCRSAQLGQRARVAQSNTRRWPEVSDICSGNFGNFESRGTGHRPVKPEPSIFEMIGSVLVISFGTAKSLILFDDADDPKVLIYAF